MISMRPSLAVLSSLLFVKLACGYTYITNDTTKLPIKWDPGQISLRIMLGSGTTLIDGSNYSSSAQTAAQTWNTQLGDEQFVVQIAAAASATDHNHVNELAFASKAFSQDFGSGVLAITTVWYSGNQRSEADTLFNTAYTWDSYRGATRSGIVDIQRVAIHELGHALGLDHPDEAGQTVAAVMNSHISSLDTLAADDITGAQNLYGPPGVPANDNFANAVPIILSNNAATLTGYNTNATKETGEPNHASNAGGHSVWWKWTAPGSGAVTVDTRGSYSDTTLGIYTGTAVSSLTTIASNDDITRGVVQASTVTFNATAGTTYFIAVDGFDADSSGLTLNVAFSPAGGTLATISTQPVSVTTTAGNNVIFSVTATAGTSTISYQWFLNGTAVSGATGATLSLTSVQAANAGSYTVVLSTAAGTVTSSAATLTVNAAPVVVTPAPTTSSGGGGGGGGGPSLWFFAALSLLGLTRRFVRMRM
jgi:hypothetical protein